MSVSDGRSPAGGEERWTVPILTCAICDKDRDPLEVPDEPCGHHYDNRRTVLVEVVPRSACRGLEEALEPFAEKWDRMVNDDELLSMADFAAMQRDLRRASSALRAFRSTGGDDESA